MEPRRCHRRSSLAAAFPRGERGRVIAAGDRRTGDGASGILSRRGARCRRELTVDRKTRIAIVGAGLGGLSAAGFLQRAGFTVRVFEQAPAFSRIGAGIILSANVTKVLRRLGIEEALCTAGIKSQSYVSRAWDTGETLYEIIFDAEKERHFGGPYVHIHR